MEISRIRREENRRTSRIEELLHRRVFSADFHTLWNKDKSREDLAPSNLHHQGKKEGDEEEGCRQLLKLQNSSKLSQYE